MIPIKESESENGLSKDDILRELATLNLPKDQYWISYKAALVLYGIIKIVIIKNMM